MKYLILGLIKFYWLIIPSYKRRKCIYRKSCSNAVFETAKNKGFFAGINMFKYRFQNCRSGYEMYEDPIDKSLRLILPNNGLLEENEIAKRLLIRYEN